MEKKLQESASILEKARAHARKVKQEFERIKKKRCMGIDTPIVTIQLQV